MGEECRRADEPRRFHVGDADNFCVVCGEPLETWQLAAIVDGNLTDFENRTTGTITLTICSECLDAILAHIDEGLVGAINRYISRNENGDSREDNK